MVEYVSVSLEENENMGCVKKYAYMDVVLLDASKLPPKPPRYSDVSQMAILGNSSNNSTRSI